MNLSSKTIGTVRLVTGKFLFLPMLINGERRWLTRANWTERLDYPGGDLGAYPQWIPIAWVPDSWLAGASNV